MGITSSTEKKKGDFSLFWLTLVLSTNVETKLGIIIDIYCFKTFPSPMIRSWCFLFRQCDWPIVSGN